MSDDLISLMKERRSKRSFKETPLEKKVINEIIQAGRYAPSAKNIQPWQFIVITNKEKIQELSEAVKAEMKKILKRRYIYQFFSKELKKKENLQALYGLSMVSKDLIFYNAPLLVFIVSKKAMFNDESCACCAQNMMLAAHSFGIGSCWIGYANLLRLNKKIVSSIGVPENRHISAALVFGYPTKEKTQAPLRKPTAEVIKWLE